MKDILISIKELETYLEKSEFKGYEFDDYLGSPIVSVLTFNSLIFKRIAIQIGKLSPINFRKLLGVKKLRSTYLPDTEIDLFTNASLPINIPKIDKVFLKFDAGFNEIEKPKDKTTKSDIIQNIINANLNPKIIQSMWLKGESGNYTEDKIKEYISDIKKISKVTSIDLLQIYTMLYIPFTNKIIPCKEKELIKLSNRISKETNVKTKVFHKPPEIKKKIRF